MELKVLNCFCTYSIELIFLSTPDYAEVLLETDSEAFEYRKLFKRLFQIKKKICRKLEKYHRRSEAPIANSSGSQHLRGGLEACYPRAKYVVPWLPLIRGPFFISSFFSLAYRFD